MRYTCHVHVMCMLAMCPVFVFIPPFPCLFLSPSPALPALPAPPSLPLSLPSSLPHLSLGQEHVGYNVWQTSSQQLNQVTIRVRQLGNL